MQKTRKQWCCDFDKCLNHKNSITFAFRKKLTFWKQKFGRKSSASFQFCEIYKKNEISFDETQDGCQYLEFLFKDLTKHFGDILSMEVPQCFMNPFVNIEKPGIQIQKA